MEKMYLDPKGELWSVTDRGQAGDYVPRRVLPNQVPPNVASKASNTRDKQP
jgi:streptogramin lyase